MVVCVTTACRTVHHAGPAEPWGDRVLAETAVPDGGAGSRARLLRRYVVGIRTHSGGHGGMFGGGGTRSGPARYDWVVEADGAAPSAWRSVVVASKTASAAQAALGRDEARMRLSAAPDGHALAVSLDGAATWRYIALDLGPEWVLFPSRTVVAMDPWARAPASSALLAEVLRDGAARASGHLTSGDESLGYLPLGFRLLCKHPGNEAIATPAAEVFIRHTNPLDVSYPNLLQPDAPCLQRAARQQPALRRTLRDAVAVAPARRREMAAWVLAGSGGGDDDQDAIARALTEAVPVDGVARETGHTRLFLAWSLAASIAQRGEATATAA